MQHHNGKHRKRHGQQIAVHQHHTDIHEVKAEKGRIAAELIDAGCDQLCAILIRDARPPAILHTENGKEKNQITEHSGDKAGKARLCRKAAPAERYGHMYFKENHHTAIVKKEDWIKVQKLLSEQHSTAKRATLRRLSNHFVAYRVKDGLFKGYLIMDSRWSFMERQEFMKIVDEAQNTMK